MADQSTNGTPSTQVDLSGQVAIVTGGGQGLGHDVAQAFAHTGASVVVVGRTPDKLADTVSAIETAAGRFISVHDDLQALIPSVE